MSWACLASPANREQTHLSMNKEQSLAHQQMQFRHTMKDELYYLTNGVSTNLSCRLCISVNGVNGMRFWRCYYEI